MGFMKTMACRQVAKAHKTSDCRPLSLRQGADPIQLVMRETLSAATRGAS